MNEIATPSTTKYILEKYHFVSDSLRSFIKSYIIMSSGSRWGIPGMDIALW